MNLKLRTGRAMAWAVSRLSPGGQIRPQSVRMRSVVWDSGIWTGLYQVLRFSSLGIIPLHYPYSFSSMCCCHKRDKRNKTRKL